MKATINPHSRKTLQVHLPLRTYQQPLGWVIASALWRANRLHTLQTNTHTIYKHHTVVPTYSVVPLMFESHICSGEKWCSCILPSRLPGTNARFITAGQTPSLAMQGVRPGTPSCCPQQVPAVLSRRRQPPQLNRAQRRVPRMSQATGVGLRPQQGLGGILPHGGDLVQWVREPPRVCLRVAAVICAWDPALRVNLLSKGSCPTE